MNSEYDLKIPQSQTADNPMVQRGRATQQSPDTRKGHKITYNCQQNIEQLQTPTM